MTGTQLDGAPTDGSAWIDAASVGAASRVVRGGSWNDDARDVRAACRPAATRRTAMTTLVFAAPEFRVERGGRGGAAGGRGQARRAERTGGDDRPAARRSVHRPRREEVADDRHADAVLHHSGPWRREDAALS